MGVGEEDIRGPTVQDLGEANQPTVSRKSLPGLTFHLENSWFCGKSGGRRGVGLEPPPGVRPSPEGKRAPRSTALLEADARAFTRCQDARSGRETSVYTLLSPRLRSGLEAEPEPLRLRRSQRAAPPTHRARASTVERKSSHEGPIPHHPPQPQAPHLYNLSSIQCTGLCIRCNGEHPPGSRC